MVFGRAAERGYGGTRCQITVEIPSMPDNVLAIPLAAHEDAVTFSDTDRFHPLHNGYITLITDEKGNTYVSVEQMMMRAKADLFVGNEALADEIMETTDYATIKALGRRVSGFDGHVWSRHCERIVEHACELKFAQNPCARAVLLETGDHPLIQESNSESAWSSPGQNLMGSILQRVRSRLWQHML